MCLACIVELNNVQEHCMLYIGTYMFGKKEENQLFHLENAGNSFLLFHQTIEFSDFFFKLAENKLIHRMCMV